MKKKAIWRIGVALLVAILLISGCSQDPEAVETGKDEVEDPLEENEPKENEEIDLIESKVRSKLTGLYIDEDSVNKRVIAVMLDNQKDARPQAGLSQSDIVYEILAEGNITRYMAIIESEQPKEIGPVRSARDYFIERSLEYDALYVHVGGSPSGLEAISKWHIASVNGMNQGKDVLWRKSHKKAPHNTYASYSSIMKGATARKYRDEGTYEGLKFLDKPVSIGEDKATFLEFPYRANNYYSSYEYNKEENAYYRSVNGKPHKDESDGTELHTTNIIIQFVKTKAVAGDTEGRLQMDMVGQGEGYYVSGGNYIPVTWKKKSEKDMTRYYNAKGEEVKLNPGKIWIQVYPENRKNEVIIK
jgi:hypothetical protein